MENKIPKEIIKFFEKKGGHSLIVKGPAGCGKTTFSLETALYLKDKYKIVYKSTRVQDYTLLDQFPWIADTIIPKLKKDSINNVSREELHRLEGQIEDGLIDDTDGNDNIPLKTENGDYVFEFATLLPELERIYDTVESHLPDKSLVIIDSINALCDKYGVSIEKLILTLQKDLVEKTGVNLILILESVNPQYIEYFGDGVVSLNRNQYKDYSIRVLELQKLRGCEIRNSKYLFTLMDGHFRAITDTLNIPVPNNFDYKEGKGYTLGSADMDKIFGDINPEEIVMMKYDDDQSLKYIKTMLQSTLSYCESKDSGIFIVPTQTNLEGNIDDKDIIKTNRVLNSGIKQDITLEGKDVVLELSVDLIDYSLKNKKKPYLVMISLDTIYHIYGEKQIEELITTLLNMKKSGYTILILAPKNIPNIDKIEFIADKVIVTDSINNVPIIYSKKPYSILYALNIENSHISPLPLM